MPPWSWKWQQALMKTPAAQVDILPVVGVEGREEAHRRVDLTAEKAREQREQLFGRMVGAVDFER